MERKYNDTDKLMKAGKFLESKGLDIREYTIFDTSGSFKQQIPIATWLTDFAILCGGKVETGDGQLTIPDVSNRREQYIIMNFEEKLQKGYEEYLKLPKATISGENRNAELYSKQWCYFTGRACVHPHPHRHFTFLEFVYWCGKNQELYDKFIQPLNV